MNSLRIVLQRISGVLLGLGLLSVPLAYAYASVSVSVQSLSPSTSVSVGTNLSFTVAASGFTSPTYALSDGFGGGSVSGGDINSSGNFSWTPTGSDVGTHNLTVTVSDSSGDSATTEETIQVSSPPSLSIQSLSPGSSINPGTTLSFSVITSGFSSPTYSVSDNFSGSSLGSGDINSSGNFSWTPTNSDTGTHTITVYATDSSGHSANTSITVNVNSGISVALTAPSPNASTPAGSAVSFQAYAYGFTTPSFTLQDSFSGTSIVNSDINTSGNFYWVPAMADVGVHAITVTATDPYGHSASEQTTVVVEPGTSTAVAPTTTSTPITFTDYLSPGLTSNEVTELQATLKTLGFFSGSITGYYGPLTEAAVEAFQSAHGIEQLGVVGPATRAQLNTLLSGSTTATTATSTGDGYVFSNFIGYGSTGTDVTELQKRLTALGIYSGPVTGYFGSLTQAAVESFQGAHGIDQVGYVGPGTRAALDQ